MEIRARHYNHCCRFRHSSCLRSLRDFSAAQRTSGPYAPLQKHPMGSIYAGGCSWSQCLLCLCHCLADNGLLDLYERIDVWELALLRCWNWHQRWAAGLRSFLSSYRQAADSNSSDDDSHGSIPRRYVLITPLQAVGRSSNGLSSLCMRNPI
jgi:hypothetical protein